MGRKVRGGNNKICSCISPPTCQSAGVMTKGYGDYCPIAKASEVLGERWTPLILRNIHLRCHSFNEIQKGCPRMSSTLLSQRLRSLERDGVIERVPAPTGRGSRYYLTPAGQELIDVVLQMGSWGARWLELGPRDYEPETVLWGWAKFIDRDRLPRHRVVVRFDLSDRPRQPFWMLVDRPESEVCVKNPGLEEDIVVTTDRVTLTDVHRGRLAFDVAVSSGRMRIDGPPTLTRAFPTWGGLSYYADVRPARPA
jgi:DNA-binding HxlR family transcriptional regulator